MKYRDAGKEEAAARRQANRNASNYGEVTEREARVRNCIWWPGQAHTHMYAQTHTRRRRLSPSHTRTHGYRPSHTHIHTHTHLYTDA